MNTKNLLVSFVAIAMALFLIAGVSAALPTPTGDLTDTITVKIDGVDVDEVGAVSVIAGDTISVKVVFTADGSGLAADEKVRNVRIKVELEADKGDVSAVTSLFDVEEGKTYVKTLTLKVPYELKDDVSGNLTLNLKIWNSDYETEIEDILLRIQRPSYNVAFKSISVPGTIKAGETLPVNLVLKNIGYNDLDDLYVIVKIPALGIGKTAYFDDLVAIEKSNDCCDDETDTVSGSIYLQIPYETAAGTYTLEIEVSNDDLTLSETKQVAIKNEFSKTIIQTSEGLLIVNPTNELKIYRVVFPLSEKFVTVQAGSSVEVEVTPTSEVYTVNVLSMSGELIDSFTFSKAKEEAQSTSAIVILTIVLAIIFLVLLVVLIVLVTKKPQKAEEFGESYY